MSNYRDTVRDMMKDLKTAKKSDKTSTAEKKASKKSDEEAEKTGPVPDEEDLLDEILDLEEGGPNSDPIDDEEADKLLASDKGKQSNVFINIFGLQVGQNLYFKTRKISLRSVDRII